MAAEKKRARIFIRVILTVGIPVFVAALAFFGLGAYVHHNELIYPSISIEGVDISWLTLEEALGALDLQGFDARGYDSSMSIAFPDESEFIVTGADVNLEHDARHLVDYAFSRGRGHGFIMDTVGFLQRMYELYIQEGEGEEYYLTYMLDLEKLRARTNAFTQGYNDELENSGPLVYDDRIVFVKGSGFVSANEFEVFDLAIDGLYQSLADGCPVGISYVLPMAHTNGTELLAMRERVFIPPLDARYDPATDTVSECVVGVDFCLSGALLLLSNTESGKIATVDMEYTHPELTRECLEELLFRDLIGECRTSVGGSSNRYNNIVLASAAVDGYVVEPGEEFSFNQVVGRRTYERGYRSAPAFSHGQTVQAIGGGICQVSSSIYSSIMDTDLKVTERRPHGRPVAYLPRGRDATVSWGTIDFRFVNNTKYPIRIDATVEGRRLFVQVYGTIIDGALPLG